MVSDLHIGGSDYDPPGDSKSWSRELRLDYETCMVEIPRFNNKDGEFNAPSKVAVGKIDGVESIQIWR